MPTPCLHVTFADRDLKSKVDSIAPTPGYCIFIDIKDSTQMKEKGLRHWIALIHNCFANCSLFLSPFAPIKGIGDELMYYIEDVDLLTSGYTPLQLYDGLWQVATETDPHFPEVKIGAAHCDHVYPITFLHGNCDYYGIDIDLTARLKALADPKEVVVDFRFHEKIMADFDAKGDKEAFVSVRRLVGPEKCVLKGISQKTIVYRGL